MREKLKKLFNRNKKNVDNINLSEEALKDRQIIEENECKVIEEYQNILESNAQKKEELNNSVNHYNEELVNDKIETLEEENEKAKSLFVKQKQGKVKDIISAYFGQADKYFANLIFNNKKYGSKLLDFHERLADKRYKDLSGYIVKSCMIMLPVAIICFLGLKYFPMLSTLFKIISVGNGLFAINSLIKVISTYYNNSKFGGRLFQRFRNIFKGKYKENILNAKYAYERSKNISVPEINVEIKETSDDDKKDLEEALEEVKELDNSLEENKVEENALNSNLDEVDKNVNIGNVDVEINLPNIRNYGNLGMVMANDSDSMKYIDAYSSIRKSDDNDIRTQAYARLASTYGKNSKKKKNDTDINKLNSYAKMLKLLSIYGRKIHEGTSTKEENAMYLELLYRLGRDFNNDYDVTDFLSDEYDRYLKDKEEFEKQKVYKKAS